ncbi:MAG: hypothetical protein LBQ58_08805 [Synergistaceae bacterium]|nr:hypothetical protein [Synergistaceae bacterium]
MRKKIIFIACVLTLLVSAPLFAAEPPVPWHEENESLAAYPPQVREFFDNEASMNTPDVLKVDVPSLSGAVGGAGAVPAGHGSDIPGELWKYTTTEEILDYFEALPKTYMRTGIVGSFPDYNEDRSFTNEWHDMLLAVFSEDGSVFTPDEVKALGKPVVYIQGTIHGNEPSGSDAALELARRVANGEFNDILRHVTLVLLPRWNLDGAKHIIRGTNLLAARPGSEMGFDQNRDHIVMQSYASMTVHRVALDYRPVTALDMHEMGFTNGGRMPGNAPSWHYQLHDIATLPGQNPNIPLRVRQFAYDVFMKNFERDLNNKGIYWHYYDENIANQNVPKTLALSNDLTTVYSGSFTATRKYQISEGTNDEGIGRPNFGFIPSSSFLAETRSPAAFTSYLRRVYTHYLTAASLLRTAALHASELTDQQIKASEEMINANELILRLRFPGVVEKWPVAEWKSDFSGLVATSYDAIMYRSRYAFPDTTIPYSVVAKPTAYIIPDTYALRNVVGKMVINGVKFERLAEDISVPVEAYRIDRIASSSSTDPGRVGFKLLDPTAIGTSSYIRNKSISAVSRGISAVTASVKTVTLPKGTFILYTDQVPATAAALGIEPMGQRNFANYYLTQTETTPTAEKQAYCEDEGFFAVAAGEDYPIYRYLGDKSALPTYAMPSERPPFIEDSPLVGIGTITDAELTAVRTEIGKNEAPVFAVKFRVMAHPQKNADGHITLNPVKFDPAKYDYFIRKNTGDWAPASISGGKIIAEEDCFELGGYMDYYREAFLVAFEQEPPVNPGVVMPPFDSSYAFDESDPYCNAVIEQGTDSFSVIIDNDALTDGEIVRLWFIWSDGERIKEVGVDVPVTLREDGKFATGPISYSDLGDAAHSAIKPDTAYIIEYEGTGEYEGISGGHAGYATPDFKFTSTTAHGGSSGGCDAGFGALILLISAGAAIYARKRGGAIALLLALLLAIAVPGMALADVTLTLTYPEDVPVGALSVDVYSRIPATSSASDTTFTSETGNNIGGYRVEPNDDGTWTLTTPGTYCYFSRAVGYYKIFKAFNITQAQIDEDEDITREIENGPIAGTGFEQPVNPNLTAISTTDSRDRIFGLWPDEMYTLPSGAPGPFSTSALNGFPAEGFKTPVFTNLPRHFQQLTTQDEMMAYLRNLAQTNPKVHLYILGRTRNLDYEFPIVVVTEEDIPESATFDEAAKILREGSKVNVFETGQVHANEAAGGEAALVLIQEMAGEYGDSLLDRLNFVCVPRLNPEGSYLYQRTSYTGIDINRDHMRIQSIELEFSHKAFNKVMPEVVFDNHEYDFWTVSRVASGTDTGRYYLGNTSFNAEDIESTPATSLNNDPDVNYFAMNTAAVRLHSAIEGSGLRGYHYAGTGYTVNNAIARAYYAIRGSVSLLFETRGIGGGRQNFARRVFSQVVASKSLIETAAINASALKQMVATARQRVIDKGRVYGEEGDTLKLYQTASGNTRTAYYCTNRTYWLDGTLRTENAPVTQSMNDTVQHSRPRPTAYVIPKDITSSQMDLDTVKYIMDVQGAEWYEIAPGSTVPLQQYYRIGESNWAGNTPSADLRPEDNVTFPNGAIVFPMDQEPGNVIGLFFEPDVRDSSSYNGTIAQSGLVSHDISTMNYPYYRFTKDNPRAALPKYPSDALATQIVLNKEATVIVVGMAEQLSATTVPGDVTPVLSWSSDRPSVASVINGRITAVAPGTAVITVSETGTGEPGSYPSATCVVTVVAASADPGPIPDPDDPDPVPPPSGGGDDPDEPDEPGYTPTEPDLPGVITTPTVIAPSDPDGVRVTPGAIISTKTAIDAVITQIADDEAREQAEGIISYFTEETDGVLYTDPSAFRAAITDASGADRRAPVLGLPVASFTAPADATSVYSFETILDDFAGKTFAELTILLTTNDRDLKALSAGSASIGDGEFVITDSVTGDVVNTASGLSTGAYADSADKPVAGRKYIISIGILENGNYDLDPTSGLVLNVAAVAVRASSSGDTDPDTGGSSGGCDAGFGAFILLLSAGVVTFLRRKG